MKQMDCINYFPGYVETIDLDYLNNILSRTMQGDNQRRTSYFYIYANDNILGGK